MMTGLSIAFIPHWLHNPWLQLVLSIPVVFWCGKGFYIGAFKALKCGTSDMNTFFENKVLTHFQMFLVTAMRIV